MIKKIYHSNLPKTLLALMFLMSIVGAQGQSVMTNKGGVSISGNTTLTVVGNVENNTGGLIDETATTSVAIVSGNITNNGSINGRGNITLNGNWVNNNTFTCFTGTVRFNGVNQLLSGSVSTTYYNLNLDNSGIKTQTIDQTTSNILSLNSVELATAANTMYVTNASTAAITRVTGFVSSTVGGALSRVTNSVASYLFPTGSSAGTARYRPVAITPASGAANTFEVRMANYTPTTEAFDVNTKEAIICQVNPLFFHMLNHTAGADLATVNVYYDNAADGSWDAMGNWLTAPSAMWYEIAGSSTAVGAPLYVATAANQNLPATERPVALTKHALTVNLGSDASICSGNSVTLDAGNAGATFNWSNSATSQTINVNTTGTYTVTVTNPVNSCQTIDAINITVNALPSITATAAAPTICNGNSTTISAGGGSTYSWSGLGTNVSYVVNPSATTVYTVTGTDGNGCTNTANVTVNVNALPTIAASATVPSYCIGGSSTVSASGGTSYTWNNGLGAGTSHVVSPVATTVYNVTGTDGNGCTNTANVTVTVNPQPSVLATATYPSLCVGESTPLTGSGGSTYVWDNGLGAGSTHTVTPAATTTYQVTGTDINGCTNTASVTVSITTAPAVTATAAAPSICIGSSTTLTGGGALNYTWDNGLGAGPSFSVNPATTTTYNVTGTSATGCSASASVTITVNSIPAITASATVPTICAGNSSTINAGGGATYNWSGLGTNASYSVYPSTTTTYTVTGTSAAGCSNTANVTVNVNALPNVTASAVSPAICIGNSTSVSAGGGTSYSWDNSLGSGASHTVNPSATTTYNVTGTDGNGCVNTASVMVTVNNLPTISASATYPALCIGESTQLSAGGGSTYTWDNGLGAGSTQTVTPAATTTYNVTGTDGNGCVSTASVTVSISSAPAVTASANFTSICVGASATLTGGGAVNYTWDQGLGAGGSFSVSPTTTTTYAVTGTSASGCSATANVMVTVNSLPTVTASVTDADICTGTSTTISAGGGSTYLWDNSLGAGLSHNVSPVATTTYQVTGTDGNGCTGTANVMVTVNSLPTISATATDINLCTGESTTITAGGGNSYLWDNSLGAGVSHSITPAATTTYNVTGTDVNGCSSIAAVTVNVASITDAAMNPAGPFCTNDANYTFSAVNTGGTWAGQGVVNTGTGEFDPGTAGPGTHQIMYTTGGACPDTDTMDIVVNPVISATINTAGPFCEFDADLILTAVNGGGTWSGTGILNAATGSFSPSTAGVGTYDIVYTISGACPDDDTLQVVINPQADATIAAAGPYCDNLAAVNLTAAETGGSWSGTGITNITSGTFDPSVAGAGTHEIIYAISGACGDADTAAILVNETPDAVVTCVGESCFGANDGFAFVDVTGGTAPYSINWSNSEITDTIDMLTPGVYNISVTDANGCIRAASGTVDVSGDSCYTPHVFIPNIFSPNGDNNNDLYFVQGKGITNFTIRVFDRWGEKVFESTDQTEGWNGEYQGQPVEQGAYPYMVTLIFENETEVREYNGYITIVR